MNKSVSITLKVIGGIIGFILLLLVVAAILLNTQAVQDKLLGIATEKLEEKLQTKVKIEGRGSAAQEDAGA